MYPGTFYRLGASGFAGNRHHPDGVGPLVVHQVHIRLLPRGRMLVKVPQPLALPPRRRRHLFAEPLFVGLALIAMIDRRRRALDNI